MSSSEDISRLRLTAGEFGRTELMRELIEDSVDQAGFLLIDKGTGHVDIFRGHDSRGHIVPASQLVGSGAQHGAQYRLYSLERPIACQRGVDLRIEPALFAQDTGHDVAEISGFRRSVLDALDLAAEPMAFEFGQDLVQAGAGKIHLVKRLHRGESGSASFVGLACTVHSAAQIGTHVSAPISVFPEPPLKPDQSERDAGGVTTFILLLGPRPLPRLRLGVDADDTVADRHFAGNGQVH